MRVAQAGALLPYSFNSPTNFQMISKLSVSLSDDEANWQTFRLRLSLLFPVPSLSLPPFNNPYCVCPNSGNVKLLHDK
jgi:hypothetical protein